MKKHTASTRLASLMQSVDSSAGPAACWPWIGAARTITRAGYPLTRWNGRSQTVPRVIMLLCKGIADNPDTVCRHTCDNPACCNPAHLEPGTQLDNARDCIERGRRAKTYRAHTRVKKLTDEQVRAIRADGRKLRDIAAEHGVSISVVSTIRNGKAKAGVA